MKRTYRIRLRLDNCKEKFMDDQDEGVFVYQDFEYDLTEEEYLSPLFAQSLLDNSDTLVESCVKTEVMILKQK